MEIIESALSNPVVGGIGYIISLLAGLIAIVQFLGKNKAKAEVKRLQLKITNMQTTTNNQNKVEQGDKSQYFQDNSGPVSIDNRG
ncbi:hypothetical protein AYI74_13595 [Shewanella algae]|uniref:hypothetical protein n=1 Tax=Shewanella algae TaxID=38313 RepID=UPI0011B3E315|nr:hypothetical protein [Shewanella algae]TWU67802.1 hypothetical protein AYI74_13595 [Shewanella algae]